MHMLLIHATLLTFSGNSRSDCHRQRLHQRCGSASCCDGSDAWRIQRARLEEQHAASVRQRRPRFLPFADARQWARAMFFTEEADWRDWIANGEKRNPYVPREPDVVYADRGWEGWDDFLNGEIESLSDIMRPGYKRGRWLSGPLSEESHPENLPPEDGEGQQEDDRPRRS